MLYNSASDWTNAAQKRVMLFGMSGLGKTYVSNILRASGWFHYSVDYRIGTRYMGEHIVDNFKLEAMKNPFLADLLLNDGIYIGSNITFENLAPLSTYLGKPGNPAKGGIPFPEYTRRQALHAHAETNSMLDTVHFIDRAKRLYGYDNFICDTSGSMVEVINADSPADPVMSQLCEHVLPVWIEGSDAHVEELVSRFAKAPKPMYYQPEFLEGLWSEYLSNNALTEPDVDPDDFILWGYRMLLDHRLPRYRKIAQRWGVTVQADDMAKVQTHDDFNTLIARSLA
ncbi:ATPase [Amylibacter sp. IMCC11727]|uniref:ATPase n=1 Tax=Amylibacter sp. IMCC11727 TaxID=3039851 RepID=UPI00244E1CA1|nr:ATPase [Amylibacter sp. IMCC11727]WGI20658.1 ATPase [Amylibacter sp. IMCC11727]